MARGFGVVVASALGVAAARAEEGSQIVLLDLQSAIQMAISANLDVQRGALLPQIGRERIREEAGAFDPTMQLSRQRSSDTSLQPLDPFGTRPPASQVLSDDYEASVAGYLPTGGSYRAGLSTRNLRGTFNSFSDDYYTFLGVRLTQPLLRNSGNRVALAALRGARVEGDAAKWEYRQVVYDTVTATALAFYDLVRAREALRVAERSVALGQQLVRDNELRYQRGAMSSQDVVEARARAARRLDPMFAAQLGKSVAENRLKRLVYADFGAADGVGLEPRQTEVSDPDHESLQAVMAGALDVRPDFQQAKLAVEQRKILLGVERSRVLPSVDLVASYGYNGNNTTFRDSLDQVRAGESDSYSIGAVVSVPLPNRSATARRRIAEYELRRAELALENLGQDVRRQLDDAYDAILVSRERVAAGRDARALAARSLEAEEKRLRAGTSTTFLVLEQQEALAEAELREATAIALYQSAIAEFYRLCGHTLGGFGVDPAIIADARKG